MRSEFYLRIPRPLALAVLLLAASGCAGPGYYWQAASGHLELMRAREQVADLLADPSTDPALAGRLRAARDMLAFAEDSLGLHANDSYSSYIETGRRAVVWNVIATPEFSLEARRWCFPVAGCVPYRGYFDHAKAQAFADRMARKDHDVAVRGATAYSTLGWFNDPLLDTMLNADDRGLAATLFHELAHQRVYVKGDTAFNEAYASFVGQQGVRAWLLANGRADLLEGWRRQLDAREDFNRLQAWTRARLARLYRSGADASEMRPGKAAVFAELRARYERLVADRWRGTDWFGGWFESGINNADLALFKDYNAGICAFERLFATVDGDFRAFHAAVAQRADLPGEQRSAWLHAPCDNSGPDIASRMDM
ncbi:MAG: aminopeptidase [Xanthomonadales bacterium]|nr:aminopeptidase [Xanthomonadales bacterium]